MDYTKILFTIEKEVSASNLNGKIPTYIPELACIDVNKYGIYLRTIDSSGSGIGDYKEVFSIQSISKVFSLTMIINQIGEEIWRRIGVEPSGNAFNSIIQLEYEHGIPRNPFINAGALVMADILVSLLDNPKEEFMAFVKKITQDESIHYNEKVAASEKKMGFLNASLCNMMKSHGNIKNDVDLVLDFYFHQCSIEMSCEQLTKAFFIYANNGQLLDGIEILNSSQVKRINALMLTCGFYDESGEFSFTVGLPGKSGVGGGIVAVLPGSYTVAVWSPPLNEKGNSSLGMRSLELLTTKTGKSIF